MPYIVVLSVGITVISHTVDIIHCQLIVINLHGLYYKKKG